MITEKEYLDTISKILKISNEEISLDTKIKNIKDWDSLMNVRIFVKFKEKTKKKFDISEFSNFNSLKDLFNKINS